MSHSVLVGEDDATTRYLLELYCRDEPYDLTFANDGSKTIELFKNQDFDILVTDVRMPGVDGQGILSFAQETRPEVPVIVITGYGTIDDAVDFLRRGAFDYLAKPFTRDNFLHRLSLAGRNVDLRNEVDRLRRNQDSQDEYTILTADPAMNSLISRLPSLSKTDAAVIVTG
ncbi:response regulator, partial [Myxococcota bacterium]|nr:response regulator [Myxococcota bacterium]